MKRISFLLILLLSMSLACYQSGVTETTITPAAAATGAPASTAITSAPVVKGESPSPTAPASACVVTVKSLNVRKGPDADVIGWLFAGDIVTVLEDAPRGEWIKVNAGTVTGWIHSRYCKQGN